MKKILSIVLSFVMVVSLCCVSAIAEEPAADKTLFDFSTGVITNTSGLTATTERADTGKTNSAKLAIQKAKSATFNIQDADKDFSGYTYLNITMASKYAYSSKVNVVAHFKNDSGYGQLAIDVSKKNFTCYSVDIAALTKEHDISMLKDIQLYFEGWGITAASIDSAAVYYIDSIKLSNFAADTYTDVKNMDQLVVQDYGKNAGNKGTLDTTNKLFGHPTVKWATTGSSSQQVITLASATDVSAYSHINVMLYCDSLSAAANGNNVGIFLRDGSTYKTYNYTFTHIGWQTVSIPLSAYSGITMTAVKTVELWDYGWTFGYGANHDTMNIGKIWFGNKSTNVVYENEAGLPISNTGNKYVYNPSTSLVKASDYNFVNILISNDIDNSPSFALQLTGDGQSVASPIVLDFTGTKVLTLQMSKYGVVDTKTQFNTNGAWTGTGYTNPLSGLTNTVKIYKIWYSNVNVDTVIDSGTTGTATTFYQKTGLNLASNDKLCFDLYSPANLGDNYVIGVILNDGSNHAQMIHANWTDWKHFEFDVSSFNLTTFTDVKLYVADQWGFNGYTPVSTTEYSAQYLIKNVVISHGDYPAVNAIYTKKSGNENEDPFIVADMVMNDTTSAAVSVTNTATSEPVPATAILAQNKIQIAFDKAVNTDYTVTISGFKSVTGNELSTSFTYTVDRLEEEPEVATSDFELNYASSAKTNYSANAVYNYQNGTAAAKAVTLVIAIYDPETNELIDMKTEEYTNLLSARRGDISVDAGFANTDLTEYKVKAFAFDSLESIKPFCASNVIQ